MSYAVADSVWGAIGAAPLAFLVGLVVGFVLSNRYRITKRNGGT